MVIALFLVLGSGAEALTSAPRAAADPASAFADNCAGCHGAKGTGKLRGTPNFTSASWQASRTDAQIINAIRRGKGKLMPAWEDKLSDDEINGLLSYLRSLKN
jgi:cytochrome c oxidase cbb3-type subunit 3